MRVSLHGDQRWAVLVAFLHYLGQHILWVAGDALRRAAACPALVGHQVLSCMGVPLGSVLRQLEGTTCCRPSCNRPPQALSRRWSLSVAWLGLPAAWALLGLRGLGLQSKVQRKAAASPEVSRARSKRVPEEGMSKILDWLYISGDEVSRCPMLLERQGITHVLNCCERLPFASPSTTNLRLKLRDVPSEDLTQHLSLIFEFLEEARLSGQCVVHCRFGASRSVAVALAYLVMRRWRLCDAWRLVKQQREVARPNSGFVKQLIELECSIIGSASMKVSDFNPNRPSSRGARSQLCAEGRRG